jgi:predicted PurR-regulated permease PerM
MNDPVTDKAADSEGSAKEQTGPASLELAGPIDIRSMALVLLTVFAIIFFLYWAEAIVLPLVFSILLSYSLAPVVSAMEKFHIPRVLSTLLLIGTIILLATYAGYTLKSQGEIMIDKFPRAIRNVSQSLRMNATVNNNNESSLIDKVQEAASELNKATKEAVGDSAPKDSGAIRVQLEEPAFQLRDYLWSGSRSILTLLGQIATVIVLVFLFLSTGDMYKRKIVKISGPTLARKKITVQILDDFNHHIRRYLFVMLISAIFVGVMTGLAFLWLDVEQATLWGIIASILCLIPYLGPVVLFVATGLVGLLQFGTLTMALTVAFTSLIIASIQSSLLTPWLTTRSTQINRVALFIGFLFLGWLWGPIGLIIATPTLIIIKVCCDHIENLRSVGELLGAPEQKA